MDVSPVLAKRRKLAISAVLLVIVVAAAVAALPKIRLLVVSSGYQSHSTYLVYDLQGDPGKRVKLDVIGELGGSAGVKPTSLVYYAGSEQLVFGLVGKAKSIERQPFVFKICDSAGNYLDFAVVASKMDKYLGDRLLPFYITPLPLKAGEVYALEVFNGSVKVCEVSFALPG
ncbi:MAG: hypothetical protein LBL83_05510 [Clostridiales bacterium]|jgi:hypothetical protein|nr:hypothetical protein [Clostridiales bacterium]